MRDSARQAATAAGSDPGPRGAWRRVRRWLLAPAALALLLSLLVHVAMIAFGPWHSMPAVIDTRSGGMRVALVQPPSPEPLAQPPLAMPVQETAPEPLGPPVDVTEPDIPEPDPAAAPERVAASAAVPPPPARAAAEPAPAVVAVAGLTPSLARPASREPQPVPEPVSAPVTPEDFEQLAERLRHRLEDGLATAGERFELEQDGRRFEARVTPADRARAALVEVSTVSEGLEIATTLSFRRVALAHFAKLVDRWDRDLMLADDEVVGRFHANSSISVSARRGSAPRFAGPVSVSRGVRVDGVYRRDELFPEGLETRAPRVAFPERAVSEAVLSGLGERVRRFDRDAEIEFLAHGAYRWRYRPDDPWNSERLPDERLMALAGGEGVTLSVRGVLRGRVLVYARQSIVIAGSLSYARDPRLIPASSDLLGLFADRKVEIAEPDVTGPGDLVVEAAVYAGERFRVRRSQVRRQGLLQIYGSLVAGTVAATEPRYASSVHFDPRFTGRLPAEFPNSNRFELATSDGVWRPR